MLLLRLSLESVRISYVLQYECAPATLFVTTHVDLGAITTDFLSTVLSNSLAIRISKASWSTENLAMLVHPAHNLHKSLSLLRPQ
ncbi:uncharacterized protein PHALS_07126 [Plasmopara halstedii]|uniref:Uncharacterized protein n=1 Tax=Plasmopara halstedii TaxID=4781 RepID=A0A0P1B3L4_PLAHL|nr:uncharacterized protein PHALS_07126 [Plasmopara halstedii]CEG49361.1 hypothetical protein PHALS_07126 [Plasmopara halstedii]|eukprot:XP_024585730.1 hypothetical protein PHALS_07126 [Plasmopara halstedii]